MIYRKICIVSCSHREWPRVTRTTTRPEYINKLVMRFPMNGLIVIVTGRYYKQRRTQTARLACLDEHSRRHELL